MVPTDFWKNPIVVEEMTPEDKYFYLYLLTNQNTTQTGIYKITKKQMAFDLGYSIESIHSLMERFIEHHKLIRYNPDTRELAMKNWWKDNLVKGGKPVMDCIFSELKDVEDLSLIRYVSESIQNQEIRSLFESFCNQEERGFSKEHNDQNEKNTYQVTDCGEHDDTLTPRDTIRGQEEEENKNKKENKKQQQEAFNPCIEENPWLNDSLYTVEEIDSFYESQNCSPKQRRSSKLFLPEEIFHVDLNLT